MQALSRRTVEQLTCELQGRAASIEDNTDVLWGRSD